MTGAAATSAKPIPNAQDRRQFYALNYKACAIPDWIQSLAEHVAGLITIRSSIYALVAQQFSIPSWALGVLHYREASFAWNTHLANGEPLSCRTTRVPAGLIKDVEPPYTWAQAASAALQFYKDGWGSLEITDAVSALAFFEQWNGLGAWHFGVSPYLWSGTDAYVKGKFAQDHRWDPELVDEELGVVPIMKALGVK